MSRLLASLSALAALVLAPSAGQAQTVKDAVEDHVDKELQDSENKPRSKRNKRRPRRSSGRRPGRSSSDRPASGSSDARAYNLSLADDPQLVAPHGPKLPLRILPGAGRYLRLDIKLDAAYRGWLPQQYDSAEVDVASFYTWSVGIKTKFFKYLTLRRGYYESTGLASPRNKKASAAAFLGKHVPKGAKFLAMIGFPFMKTWQPIIRYETQAFNTTATPKIPLCIVARDAAEDLMDCPTTMDRLQLISSYETLVAGVLYNSPVHSTSFVATRKSKLPPVYAGIGLMSYSKPYQVNVDGNTLQEYLFDGRFRGAGLALGGDLGGGARRFFAGVDLQVGLGEVSLTDDFTLNEVTPDDWLIGYVQGNIKAGYRMVVVEGPPTVYFTPLLNAGGASFHFVRTKAEEGRNSGAPSLNWDLLWSARAALEVAL